MGTYFIAIRSENQWKVTFPRRHLSRISCFYHYYVGGGRCWTPTKCAEMLVVVGAGPLQSAPPHPESFKIHGKSIKVSRENHPVRGKQEKNGVMQPSSMVVTTRIPTRNPSNFAFTTSQPPAPNKLSCDPPPITDGCVYLATFPVGNSVRARKSTKPMISIHFGPPRTRCPGTRESTPWGRLSPPPPPHSHDLITSATL